MDIKRILTSLIGLPLVILLMTFGTPQVISFAIMIIAIICMYEYFNVIKKICKPIQWVGYLCTILIFVISLVKIDIMKKIILFGIPTILLILFMHIIISNMKTTFKDVAYTLLGIIYIVGCVIFLSALIILENGKILVGYTIMLSWSTDICAYWAGKTFGKHHFSKVSPKKTIEGCITGALAAVFFGTLYVVVLRKTGHNAFGNLQYIFVAILSLIISIISQIGDFVASSIKRFTETKDYGSMLPGHGGMLDRVDSLIFIAPFLYIFVTIMQNVLI